MLSAAAVRRSSRDLNVMKEKLIFSGESLAARGRVYAPDVLYRVVFVVVVVCCDFEIPLLSVNLKMRNHKHVSASQHASVCERSSSSSPVEGHPQ